VIDIQTLRRDAAQVESRLKTRGFVFDRAGYEALEARRKALQTRAEALQAQRNALSKQIGQAKGKVDAPVVMVIYSDFACPYCTQFAQKVEPELDKLVKQGTLRVEWRDLAQISETSPLAAQAGRAAAKQGKFWEFHDAVYAAADPQGHPTYTEDSLVAFAKKAGVPDLKKFRADMTAAETVKAVSESTNHVHSIGIQGTPFMIVGETYISGYKDADYMTAVVKSQAAKAKEAKGTKGATRPAAPASAN